MAGVLFPFSFSSSSFFLFFSFPVECHFFYSWARMLFICLFLFSPFENCNRNISAAEKVCHCFLFILLFVVVVASRNRHQMKGGPASAICLSLEFLLQGRKPKEFRSLFLSLAFSISISAGWLVHIKNVSTNSQKNFPKCSERESH